MSHRGLWLQRRTGRVLFSSGARKQRPLTANAPGWRFSEALYIKRAQQIKDNRRLTINAIPKSGEGLHGAQFVTAAPARWPRWAGKRATSQGRIEEESRHSRGSHATRAPTSSLARAMAAVSRRARLHVGEPWQARQPRCFVECAGKRSATPLWLARPRQEAKRRRRFACQRTLQKAVLEGAPKRRYPHFRG